MPDGNFGISYDGIPFGDTNGPTHHSESYFPGSTTGSAIVDRGPADAGTIGASTYGGTISLFSETPSDDFHVRQAATFGSWNTWNVNTNIQSGNLSVLGKNTRILVNFQDTGSSGYLTLQTIHHDNELVKIETDIAPNWTLTLGVMAFDQVRVVAIHHPYETGEIGGRRGMQCPAKRRRGGSDFRDFLLYYRTPLHPSDAVGKARYNLHPSQKLIRNSPVCLLSLVLPAAKS